MIGESDSLAKKWMELCLWKRLYNTVRVQSLDWYARSLLTINRPSWNGSGWQSGDGENSRAVSIKLYPSEQYFASLSLPGEVG